MIHIEEGDYYTLTDIALRLKKSKQAIFQRATKLGIKPLKFGRLQSRYHERDLIRIERSYIWGIDNSK